MITVSALQVYVFKNGALCARKQLSNTLPSLTYNTNVIGSQNRSLPKDLGHFAYIRSWEEHVIAPNEVKRLFEVNSMEPGSKKRHIQGWDFRGLDKAAQPVDKNGRLLVRGSGKKRELFAQLRGRAEIVPSGVKLFGMSDYINLQPWKWGGGPVSVELLYRFDGFGRKRYKKNGVLFGVASDSNPDPEASKSDRHDEFSIYFDGNDRKEAARLSAEISHNSEQGTAFHVACTNGSVEELSTWQRVVVTVNDPFLRLYKNGELHETQRTALKQKTPLLEAAQRHFHVLGLCMEGVISYANFWGGCLEPLEVAHLFKRRNGEKNNEQIAEQQFDSAMILLNRSMANRSNVFFNNFEEIKACLEKAKALFENIVTVTNVHERVLEIEVILIRHHLDNNASNYDSKANGLAAARTYADKAAKLLGEDNHLLFEFFEGIGDEFEKHEHFEQAREFFERSLFAQERLFGGTDWQITIKTLKRLGALLRKMLDLRKAEEYLARFIDASFKFYMVDRSTIDMMQVRAELVDENLSDYTKGKSLYQECMARNIEFFPEDTARQDQLSDTYEAFVTGKEGGIKKKKKEQIKKRKGEKEGEELEQVSYHEAMRKMIADMSNGSQVFSEQRIRDLAVSTGLAQDQIQDAMSPELISRLEAGDRNAVGELIRSILKVKPGSSLASLADAEDSPFAGYGNGYVAPASGDTTKTATATPTIAKVPAQEEKKPAPKKKKGLGFPPDSRYDHPAAKKSTQEGKKPAAKKSATEIGDMPALVEMTSEMDSLFENDDSEEDEKKPAAETDVEASAKKKKEARRQKKKKQEEKELNKAVKRYNLELCSLSEMGFSDKETNVAALKACSLDIMPTMDLLSAFQEVQMIGLGNSGFWSKVRACQILKDANLDVGVALDILCDVDEKEVYEELNDDSVGSEGPPDLINEDSDMDMEDANFNSEPSPSEPTPMDVDVDEAAVASLDMSIAADWLFSHMDSLDADIAARRFDD
ncbi:hypothetical protein TrVE_jg6341 [Triparma verrucosa]|uniref:Uncharacterized protein n=1 Tax=Triparma verrucosa TaxID=1606542 RepID=A0A9W7BZI4_9STRA|nr:hypothetical protein TrVE_jg6341 [Triparma verrucosa]